MLRFNEEGLLTHVRITWATEDRQGGSKMIEEKEKVHAAFQKMLKAVRKADTENFFGEIRLYAEWFETAERDANLPKWTFDTLATATVTILICAVLLINIFAGIVTGIMVGVINYALIGLLGVFNIPCYDAVALISTCSSRSWRVRPITEKRAGERV